MNGQMTRLIVALVGAAVWAWTVLFGQADVDRSGAVIPLDDIWYTW